MSSFPAPVSHRELARLADQDRALWNRELLRERQATVRKCLRLNRPDAAMALSRNATERAFLERARLVLARI